MKSLTFELFGHTATLSIYHSEKSVLVSVTMGPIMVTAKPENCQNVGEDLFIGPAKIQCENSAQCAELMSIIRARSLRVAADRRKNRGLSL